MAVLALRGPPLWQSASEPGLTVRPIGRDRVIVASPNHRFWGFWEGEGLGESTSGLLEGAFFVRLCQGFSVDFKLRGLPPRRA